MTVPEHTQSCRLSSAASQGVTAPGRTDHHSDPSPSALCCADDGTAYVRCYDAIAAEVLKVNKTLLELGCAAHPPSRIPIWKVSAAADMFAPSSSGSLRGNSLGSSPEGWCAIFAALRDNKDNQIESWDLSEQGINVEIAKVLAEYVSASTALKSLKYATACCPAPHSQRPLTPADTLP